MKIVVLFMDARYWIFADIFQLILADCRYRYISILFEKKKIPVQKL